MKAIVRHILMSIPMLLASGCNGCSEDKRRQAFARVAFRTDNALTKMRPAAAAVLAAKPDDRAAIIEACTSVDLPLHLLRKVRFDDEALAIEWIRDPPSEYADTLMAHRYIECGHPGDYVRGGTCAREHRIRECARWCVEQWTGLVQSVDRLRDEAKKHGVEIVSLRPE
jgi:hypothetical protein